MSHPDHSQQHTDFSMRVLSTQADDLKARGQRVVNDPRNDRVAVLVEPRNHPFLPGVVRNVMYFLNGLGHGTWNLHVFCGTTNADAVRALFPGWEFTVTSMGVANIDTNQHNKLLLSTAFWEAIAEENVLIFQTDSMMFRPLPDDLIACDMIGAHYLNPNEQTPLGRGYNGGFNFRKKSAVLDCLRGVTLADVSAYRAKHGKPELPSVAVTGRVAEDVFLVHAMEMLGKALPSKEAACRFSTEAVYNRTSVGIHAAMVKAFFPFEALVDMVRSSELVRYL